MKQNTFNKRMTKKTKKDYLSKDGFNTNIWGPSLWHFLHIISFNYPPKATQQDKLDYYFFLMSLGKVLPCGVCRNNYNNNLTSAGLEITQDRKKIVKFRALKDRHEFSKFIFRLHREVSRMKKTQLPCSFYRMRETYENFRAKCVANTKTKHGGCILSTVPSRSVLRIIPKEKSFEVPTFEVDKRCFVR